MPPFVRSSPSGPLEGSVGNGLPGSCEGPAKLEAASLTWMPGPECHPDFPACPDVTKVPFRSTPFVTFLWRQGHDRMLYADSPAMP